MKTPFTSVPVAPAISIIRQKLKQDTQLHPRVSMSIQHTTTLLESCLKTPISSSKVSIMKWYMRQQWYPLSDSLWPTSSWEFKTKAFNLVTHPPRLWPRCMYDTFVIQKIEYSNQFLQCVNSFHADIQFTQETSNLKGSIPVWVSESLPQVHMHTLRN